MESDPRSLWGVPILPKARKPFLKQKKRLPNRSQDGLERTTRSLLLPSQLRMLHLFKKFNLTSLTSLLSLTNLFSLASLASRLKRRRQLNLLNL